MPDVTYDPVLHGARRESTMVHRPAFPLRDSITIEDAAHLFLASFLADIDAGGGEQEVYATERFTCRAYLIAGNGPTAWVYVIKGSDGALDSVFLSYTETAEAVIPVPSAWAEDVAAWCEAQERR